MKNKLEKGPKPPMQVDDSYQMNMTSLPVNTNIKKRALSTTSGSSEPRQEDFKQADHQSAARVAEKSKTKLSESDIEAQIQLKNIKKGLVQVEDKVASGDIQLLTTFDNLAKFVIESFGLNKKETCELATKLSLNLNQLSEDLVLINDSSENRELKARVAKLNKKLRKIINDSSSETESSSDELLEKT